jgi:hypothetical protein
MAANEFPGKAPSVGRDLIPVCCLGCKAKQAGRSEAGWKDGCFFQGHAFESGGVGAAVAKAGWASAIVNPFAETLNDSFLFESGKGLRDGGKGEIIKIFQAPKAFASPFDPLPDREGDFAGAFRAGGGFGHESSIECCVLDVKFFC